MCQYWPILFLHSVYFFLLSMNVPNVLNMSTDVFQKCTNLSSVVQSFYAYHTCQHTKQTKQFWTLVLTIYLCQLKIQVEVKVPSTKQDSLSLSLGQNHFATRSLIISSNLMFTSQPLHCWPKYLKPPGKVIIHPHVIPLEVGLAIFRVLWNLDI